MTRIDFYVLQQDSLIARVHYACRLAEKAINQNHHVMIAVKNESQANEISEYLWSFKPESFLPHNLQEESVTAPIVITWSQDHDSFHDVLINLSDDIPESFSRFQRVTEIVVQQQECLKSTRAHYQFYRDRGYPLKSHRIQA